MPSPECRRRAGSALVAGWAVALGCVLLLAGCATRAPRDAPPPETRVALSEERGASLVAAWQHRLAEYLERNGGGDPALLSRLPSLRATGTLRPARIGFTATDLEATVPERDGFDVMGLLLGKSWQAGETWYLFIVGTVERAGYRPVAVSDLRLAAMTLRDGVLAWRTGSPDPQSLARYRGSADATATPRFPADRDRFVWRPCAAGLCVEEQNSGARWTLGFGA